MEHCLVRESYSDLIELNSGFATDRKKPMETCNKRIRPMIMPMFAYVQNKSFVELPNAGVPNGSISNL